MGALFQPPRPLTAVIVTYQSAGTLDLCIDAVKRGYDEGLLSCVFVDNGSSDGTIDMLRERASPWAEVLLTGVNNGFGRGCNIGFERVATALTIFINPDAIVEPDAIRTMLHFMEKSPGVGIVGPAILEGQAGSEYTMQATGERMTPRKLLAAAMPLMRQPAISYPIVPGTAAARTGWVCGAVFMIRTELMARLGGFDPRFFLYWEETDVCKRAEDLGYEICALGAAVAHHIGGASSSADSTRIGGCIARHYFQSRFYYMVKHHGWLSATLAEAGEFILLTMRSALEVARGRRAERLRSRMQAPLFSQPKRV